MKSPSTAAGPVSLEELIAGIDRGIEVHLAWSQKLMRCSLLRESPGDDMLRPNAHELCRFGLWFAQVRTDLERFDGPMVGSIAQAHRSMHEAVSAMCAKVLAGSAAQATDLVAYERNQSEMVRLLNALRQHIAGATMRHDVLTGLPLRHGMEHAFELRRRDAQRTGASLWLAMVDIDHFKSVNDAHGHAVGDLALRHVADALLGSLRENDSLIRFGGEEFLGLFLIAQASDVEVIAQRMLDALHATPLHTEQGLVIHLTATAGWARVRANEDLPSAVQRADHALLQGKTHGRDRFVLAPD